MAKTSEALLELRLKEFLTLRDGSEIFCWKLKEFNPPYIEVTISESSKPKMDEYSIDALGVENTDWEKFLLLSISKIQTMAYFRDDVTGDYAYFDSS